MITGTLFLFWQQGGSSISLFIDRFVNRHWLNMTSPTALFQSVNAIAVMAVGVVLAWLSSLEREASPGAARLAQFCRGLVLMGGGFIAGAKRASGPVRWAGITGMMIAGWR